VLTTFLRDPDPEYDFDTFEKTYLDKTQTLPILMTDEVNFVQVMSLNVKGHQPVTHLWLA